MKTRSIIGSVLAAVVFFQSCTKEETSSPRVTLIEKIVKDVPADTIIGLSQIGQPLGSGKFTFYSFENNAIVANRITNEHTHNAEKTMDSLIETVLDRIAAGL